MKNKGHLSSYYGLVILSKIVPGVLELFLRHSDLDDNIKCHFHAYF